MLVPSKYNGEVMSKTADNYDELFKVVFEKPFGLGAPRVLHVCQPNGDSKSHAHADVKVVESDDDVELHCSCDNSISCFQAIIKKSELKEIDRKIRPLRLPVNHRFYAEVDGMTCAFERDNNIHTAEVEGSWKKFLLGFRSAKKAIANVAAML